MRNILIISSFFFLIFFYGLILSQTNINVLANEELEPKNHSGFYDYRGVTDVFTNRSKGSGSAAEVVAAAQEVGLDFLFINDLNVFNQHPVEEGYHQKLLTLFESQYSYLDSHLQLYDIGRRHNLDSLGQSQTLLADLLSQMGPDAKLDLIILSHPQRQGYAWSGPIPSGLDGLEVINLKSVWDEAWDRSKISFLWSAIVYPFNSHLALVRLYDEPEAELKMWDDLSSKRQTIGIVGADATAKTHPASGAFLRFPTYQTSFSLASNHLLLRSELTGNAESDRHKVLTAMNEGQLYIALDVLGNPKGFVAYLQDADKIHSMGSTTKWAPNMRIVVSLPQKPRVPFEAALFKDGQHVMSANSAESEFEIHGPGVYRIAIRVFVGLTLPDGNRWITWIYTNPFTVQ